MSARQKYPNTTFNCVYTLGQFEADKNHPRTENEHNRTETNRLCSPVNVNAPKGLGVIRTE